MFIRTTNKYINLDQVTHAIRMEESLMIYFSSSDVNAQSNSNPMLRLTGKEAEAVEAFLARCAGPEVGGVYGTEPNHR